MMNNQQKSNNNQDLNLMMNNQPYSNNNQMSRSNQINNPQQNDSQNQNNQNLNNNSNSMQNNQQANQPFFQPNQNINNIGGGGGEVKVSGRPNYQSILSKKGSNPSLNIFRKGANKVTSYLTFAERVEQSPYLISFEQQSNLKKNNKSKKKGN